MWYSEEKKRQAGDIPMSYRREDSNAEQAFARFLDKYFYPRYFDYAERMYGRGPQLSGIDVVAQKDGISYNIDEKAQLHYINKDLPTFAFELSSTRMSNGAVNQGWLLNGTLLTDKYLLLWPFARTNSFMGIQEEDFCAARFSLVDRAKLIHFLCQNGFSPDALEKDVARIRQEDMAGRVYSDNPDIYYYRSTQLDEGPINLVIKRKLIDSIADGSGYIQRP